VFKVSESRIKPVRFNAEPYRRDAPDPIVEKIINEISDVHIRTTVVHISNPNIFYTRNSFAPDTVDAAEYLRGRFEALGCKLARVETFQARYAPNIFCELPGTEPSLPRIYVGAHYDSRGPNVNSATDPAPGADDNGSGTAGLLEILRSIQASGHTFKKTISFGLWAGEEQGLVGSDYAAYRLSTTGVRIEAYINLDMIGYPSRTYPNALWWSTRGVTSSITQLGISLTRTYLGDDVEIRESTGCCSDNQSFLKYSFPAASVFESSTATLNPNYHRATDTASTVNYQHAKRTTQAAAALILTLAST